MRIRTGDNVLVIAGRDKGKTGRVERNLPGKGRVVVEGVNVVTKHMRGQPGVRAGRAHPVRSADSRLQCRSDLQ